MHGGRGGGKEGGREEETCGLPVARTPGAWLQEILKTPSRCPSRAKAWRQTELRGSCTSFGASQTAPKSSSLQDASMFPSPGLQRNRGLVAG